MGEFSNKVALALGILFLGSAPLPLRAAPLSKPSSLSVANGVLPRISWKAVPGAALYRVAIFEAGGAAAQGPLVAAVWLRSSEWTYGVDAVVAKAGGLPSTSCGPLTVGKHMHVMVRATDAKGGNASAWTSTNFVYRPAKPAQAGSFSALAISPSAVSAASATPTATPAPQDSDAELEIQGGTEFKSAAEPGDANLTASAGSDSGATAAAQSVSKSPRSASDAAALLKAGHYDDAEAAYRALLDQDPKNADEWEGLGDVYRAQAMKVEAADCYEKALKFGTKKQSLQDWLDQNVRH